MMIHSITGLWNPPTLAVRVENPPVPPASSDAADTSAGGVPTMPNVEHAPPHAPATPLIKALDANADGVVDRSEMAQASLALLALDANQDGQLTPDEYRPASLHAGHPGAGRGQQRPGPAHRPAAAAHDGQP